MAGIGIRYAELARRLPRPGIEVAVITPGDPEAARAVPGMPADVRRFVRGGLRELVADCDAAVAQGQLANDLVLEVPELPAAIDLFDPWLVENLHYARTLGPGPFRNDHASWVLQLSRGDLFLCSSAEQRLFYLGFLAALGRVNPARLAADAGLERLVAVVPFGCPPSCPRTGRWLPPRAAGERRILFGGLYDWYDPWPLLAALARLDRPAWRAVRGPQRPTRRRRRRACAAEVEARCRSRAAAGRRACARSTGCPRTGASTCCATSDLMVLAAPPGARDPARRSARACSRRSPPSAR